MKALPWIAHAEKRVGLENGPEAYVDPARASLILW